MEERKVTTREFTRYFSRYSDLACAVGHFGEIIGHWVPVGQDLLDRRRRLERVKEELGDELVKMGGI